MKSTAWLHAAQRSGRRSIELVCLPYAGGSDAIYRRWVHLFDSAIEVCPLRLPGRGARLRDEPYEAMEHLVNDASAAMADSLTKPFALFGHSMGALIAFELARRLSDIQLRPLHLFVSAACSPDRWNFSHSLEPGAIVDTVRGLSPASAQALADPQFAELFLPMLRADFTLCTRYAYRPGAPLRCPITAFGGREDAKISQPELLAWRQHTTAGFVLHNVPGDHFFLHSAADTLTQIIGEELALSFHRIDSSD